MRVSNIPEWQDEFIENEGLDGLRNFVRYGKGYKIWPYYTRKIYAESQISFDPETKRYYEKLHEFDFLFPDKPKSNQDKTEVSNLYFVMSIMGIEYVINMTNAGLSRYFLWLSENNEKSILLMDKSGY